MKSSALIYEVPRGSGNCPMCGVFFYNVRVHYRFKHLRGHVSDWWRVPFDPPEGSATLF